MKPKIYYRVMFATVTATLISAAPATVAQEVTQPGGGDSGFFGSQGFTLGDASSSAPPAPTGNAGASLPQNPKVETFEKQVTPPANVRNPFETLGNGSRRGQGDGFGVPGSAVASPFTRTAPRYTEGGREKLDGKKKNMRVARITPFVGASVTYSDNVNLSADNEESGFIYGAGAGVTADYVTNRIDAVGTIGAEARFGDIDDNIMPYAQGAGTAEIIRDKVFIDATAAYTMIFDNPLQGATYSGAGTGDGEGLAQFSVSPYWREKIGNWGVSEVRYAHDYATSTSDSIGTIQTDAIQAKLATARPINGIGLEGLVAHADTRFDDPPGIGEGDMKQTTGQLTGTYGINRKVALIGQVGYDRVTSDGTDDDKFSGAFYNVGFEYRPNERGRVQALVGRRYNGFNYLVDASYQITDKMYAGATGGTTVQPPVGYGQRSFRLSGSQTDAVIQTANDEFGGNVAEALRQRYNIEGRDVGIANDGALIIGNNINTRPFNANTVSAYAGVNDGATTYNIVGAYEKRDFQVVEDEEAITAVASVSHKYNSKWTFGGEAFYYALLTDFQANENVTFGGRATAAYAITDYADLFGAISRTQREAELSQNDFVEHAVTLGINARF